METNSMGNAEKNKNVVRRFFKAFGAADVSALDQLLPADFVPHGMPPGYSNDGNGLKKMATDFKAASGSCQNEIEDLVAAEGDKVVARFTTRAVHTGELFGVPPSGRTITMTGMEMYRVSGDMIAELWGEYNVSELFGQAG